MRRVGLPLLFVLLASCGRSEWIDAQGKRVQDGSVVNGATPMLLSTRRGPAHCALTDVTFLDIAWPLGTVSPGANEGLREYVWGIDDSHGLTPGLTSQRKATPPTDAADTGYRRDGVALWIAPSDSANYVYLRQADGTFDRWARAPRLTGCA